MAERLSSLLLFAVSPVALAQDGGADAPPRGVMTLFWESFDLFTVLIVLGSVVSVAIIIRSAIEVREGVILPSSSVDALKGRVKRMDWVGLKRDAEKDSSFVGRVVNAALQPVATGRIGARENAELAASDEAAKWFRRIEMLNVIGHLGPLLGLVGTVYGMIIAFAALGETGGRAGPGELSLGISKALFHTFLGLMLAIPSLLAYGYFRTTIDRICTRAMVIAGQIVESIPDEALETQGGSSRQA
jgi:biopolymer transport protein ExbB